MLIAWWSLNALNTHIHTQNKVQNTDIDFAYKHSPKQPYNSLACKLCQRENSYNYTLFTLRIKCKSML